MRTNISFEFFPPKTTEDLKQLEVTATKLRKFNPKYFSVTYGAGGSTQERTLETVERLYKTTQTPTAPHITCIASTKQKITSLLDQYRTNGIKHLVVLRGDLPSGLGNDIGDFRYASDLVKFIRELTDNYFYIEVAAYPEFHPQALDASKDLYHFKEKVLAGANSALTQYFYNIDAYFRFLELCQKLQINIPIIPGIMPIVNYKQLQRFSHQCGAEIPRWLQYRLQSFGEDLESLKKFGLEVVTKLCEKLLAGGAPGLHFYTLNKAETSTAILKNLKLSRSVDNSLGCAEIC